MWGLEQGRFSVVPQATGCSTSQSYTELVPEEYGVSSCLYRVSSFRVIADP